MWVSRLCHARRPRDNAPDVIPSTSVSSAFPVAGEKSEVETMDDERTPQSGGTDTEQKGSPQAGTTPSGPAPQGPGMGKPGGSDYRPGQGGTGGGGYQPGQSEMPGGITSRPDGDPTRGTDASES